MNSSIYKNQKNIEISKVEKPLNKLLDGYYSHYDGNASHVSVKMGDSSYIAQEVTANFLEDKLELVYSEKITLTSDRVHLNVRLKECFFYNKRQTNYERVLPEEIRQGSTKGKILEKHKIALAKKSDDLFNHVLQVLTEPQPSQVYQR